MRPATSPNGKEAAISTPKFLVNGDKRGVMNFLDTLNVIGVATNGNNSPAFDFDQTMASSVL
jgi:hypothetical protein